MKARSLACQVSALGLVVMSGGGLWAASATADPGDPTSGAGFRITKTSEDGTPLPGVRYEATFCFYDIYSAPDDRTWNCQTNEHWVTNNDGHLVLNDPSDVNDGIPFEQYPLVYGCPYCGDTSEITVVVGVREVEAPTGYDKDDNSYSYYPGYLADGSDKWGHATANPGLDTGVATKVSQDDLGDLGDLKTVSSPDFNGYEAVYVNKFTRSPLDIKLTDDASGEAVPGAKFTATVCTGDPETCSQLPNTFTSGDDGLLRDENGNQLSTVVSPKLIDGAKVTLTQTSPAPGYENVGPVVLTHTGGSAGWTSSSGKTAEAGPVEVTATKKTPTTDPTTPTTDPTSPTTDPTTPTTDPTTPTTDPTSPTTPTTPTTDPTTPTTDPTSPTTKPTTPTTDPTSPTTKPTTPTTKPTTPTTKPTTPTTDPTTPTTEPTSPTTKPSTSTSPATTPGNGGSTTGGPTEGHHSSTSRATGVPGRDHNSPSRGTGPVVNTDRTSDSGNLTALVGGAAAVTAIGGGVLAGVFGRRSKGRYGR